MKSCASGVPGSGCVAEVVDRPAYRVARDMWVIDDVRLKTLAQYGVVNQRVMGLHERAHNEHTWEHRFQKLFSQIGFNDKLISSK